MAHCGESTEGFYLNTLSAVDVATGWVECRGVWGKGQERVGGAIHQIGQRLPFLSWGWTRTTAVSSLITAYTPTVSGTRSPSPGPGPTRRTTAPTWSRRTGRLVRRLIGYERLQLQRGFGTASTGYTAWSVATSISFSRWMQLREEGPPRAKVHKVYDTARNPYRRLLDSAVLTGEQRDVMATQYLRLNPVRLLRQINQALEQLWAMANTTSGHEPR